jgi:putative ABC transport system permease protein
VTVPAVLADLLFRLRALTRRHVVERELDEELRLHLDQEIEKYVQAGLPRPEAVRRAQLAFGRLDAVKEQCRDARGVLFVETTMQDVRHAFRTLRRSPSFAAAAILSLTLGIGANTAIFTLIEAVMLRPLPVRTPDELVSVGDASRPTALWEGGPMVDVLSYPLYQRLRDHNRVFSGILAAGRAGRVQFGEGGVDTEDVLARLVSANYFHVLGVSAVLGRTFRDDEDRAPGAGPVVVISDRFWARRFGRALDIVGRKVWLNGQPLTIVGVGPQSFTGEVVGSPTDVWIPLSMQPQIQGQSRLNRSDSNWLLGLGRLERGVSLEQARTKLNVIAQQALADFQGGQLSEAVLRGQHLPVQPGGRGFSWIRKNTSTWLITLMVVVAFVLLIACANVANLSLARAASRQKEIAVRLAIGAGRARLIRQLLTEGSLLAAASGLASLTVARWGSRVLSQLHGRGGPNPIPFDVDVRPNLVVMGYTVVVCVATTTVFALVPAIRSTRVELTSALKQGRGVAGGGRWVGRLLVVGQVALAVPLLIVAGVFVRGLRHLETLDVGYARDNVLVVKADLPRSAGEFTAALPNIDRALERLRSITGVQAATVSQNGLFGAIDSSTQGLRIDGFEASRKEDAMASFDQVGPGYFQAIGIPLLEGREFDDRDTTRAPSVAVVNDTMARFYFGEQSSLGKVIQNGHDRYTIVGVVKDSRQRDLRAATIERRFYIPLRQTSDDITTLSFVIQTHGNTASIIPAVRRELQDIGTGLNVTMIEAVRTLMSQSLSGERSVAQLSSLFALLALTLASAGLYGVTSHATARRTNEIGLRMALGASRSLVTRMVLREALMLTVAGLAVGLPGAFIVLRVFAAGTVGVNHTDATAFVGATVAMLVVSIIAAGVPAWRASRVDPLVALRQD